MMRARPEPAAPDGRLVWTLLTLAAAVGIVANAHAGWTALPRWTLTVVVTGAVLPLLQ